MIRRFTAGPLPGNVEAALCRLADANDVEHVAVLPDVHLAEDVCVGVAVATTSTLYPAAVGGDIGCGMAAIRFDVEAAAVDMVAAARVLEGLYQRIPRDRRRREDWRACDLQVDGLSSPALAAMVNRDVFAQMGTLGSGNHFVELQRDEYDGALWLMVHSGSRGLGPTLRGFHESRGVRGRNTGLVAIEADSEGGKAYLNDVGWALAYAEANRRALVEATVEAVTSAIGAHADESTLITCQHNHVCRQGEHWVHRKGAMPAGEGVAGVIPGSMGTPSYHVVGRGHPGSLASSAHGAGRAMSRGEARRLISARALAHQLGGVWWDQRKAEQLRDEAPAAYKDIQEVMQAQRELVRIVRRLEPVLSYKAG
jgi:tRNA-splicing ligase RtcB